MIQLTYLLCALPIPESHWSPFHSTLAKPLKNYRTMGASASKPTETKVFTPKTNIELGPGLVGQLEQSIETDYARSQYTEKAFEAEVSKKLDRIAKEASEKFDQTIKDSLLTKDSEKDKTISSQLLDGKLTKLQQDLEKRESKFVKVPEEVTKTKSEIVECLIKNKERPLNCWDEVKKFEKLVNQIN